MPRLKIAWHTVPDSLFATADNSTISRQLGCTAENVRIERKRRGIPPHRGKGKAAGDATGTRRGTIKPAIRLSRPALIALQQLAANAGVNPSEYILQIARDPFYRTSSTSGYASPEMPFLETYAGMGTRSDDTAASYFMVKETVKK